MNETLVETRYGRLQGTVENSVRIWRGIPYAKPPLGDMRFRPPAAAEAWEGIKQATTFGPICPQPGGGAILGMIDIPREQSEDCLYLNIWAPAVPKPGGSPVLVWIHGGAFVTGHGSVPIYDGSQFARSGDVMVVTFNYRLGPFGFLHLAPVDRSLGSNLGLQDQVAALQWVRDNIAAFGGDPDRVTVFGESAGSMSIAALLTLPAAKGLFQQAIMESGASQVMSDGQATEVTRRFLQELGAEQDAVNRLLGASTSEIMEAAGKLREGLGSILTFQPVVEEATLPQEPIRAIEAGAAAGIPVLIGTNRDEGVLFVRPDAPISEEAVSQALQAMVGPQAAKLLLQHYPATAEAQAQMITDLVFWRSSVQLATAQAQYAPVWMYRFDWTLPSHPLLGKAIHAAEIAFVFNNIFMFSYMNLPVDSETFRLAQLMQDAWVSFAVHGTPERAELSWPRYEPERRATMVFDRSCRVLDDPDTVKREVLSSI
ncbi:carboxylesterase/lipase family protein [Paenibacillus silviterrae]|uniref:carboxylesterase/lipase family protein n=1 Tax=Paenibacillus silviterrae TaxID=3242194 RepID=UPI0025438C8E|nr:carboxylesterase/lipase family protein [Paenibacillus chinjuensis]